MKKTVLSNDQQQIVLSHLYLVPYVVRTRIRRNETIYGLGYEELQQEGYYLLCKAAITYNPASGDFEPYARRIIYNGLISQCRKVYQYERHFLPLQADEQGNPLPSLNNHFETDAFAQRVEMIEILDLLSFYARKYRGTTRCGIEALAWTIQGMSITEIAEALHTPPSHVGAWITKAKRALCHDSEFRKTVL